MAKIAAQLLYGPVLFLKTDVRFLTYQAFPPTSQHKYQPNKPFWAKLAKHKFSEPNCFSWQFSNLQDFVLNFDFLFPIPLACLTDQSGFKRLRTTIHSSPLSIFGLVLQDLHSISNYFEDKLCQAVKIQYVYIINCINKVIMNVAAIAARVWCCHSLVGAGRERQWPASRHAPRRAPLSGWPDARPTAKLPGYRHP